MNYTFISGATGGIGQAYAMTCAAKGYKLFLTGRSAQKLEALKHRIFGLYPMLEVEIFPCDLTDEKSRVRMYEYIDMKGLRFDRIVNVAGVDTQMAFQDYTMEKLLFQVRVNVESTLANTLALLERRAAETEVITVASMSGATPMPYFAVYSATKNCLVWFFSALRQELKDKGVKVTTVMPGGVPTRPDIIEDIKGQGLWGKLSAKPAGYVAEISLKKAAKNKRLVIPGFFNKFLYYLMKIVPFGLKTKFIARRWSKLKKDAF